MAKNKPIFVPVDVYFRCVIGLIGWTPEEAREWTLKRFGTTSDGWDEHWTASYCRTDEHILIIHSGKPWTGTFPEIAALSHECNHISSFIFQSIGAGHDLTNEEPYTYLQQYLLQSFLERLGNVGEGNDVSRPARKKSLTKKLKK